MDLIRAFEAELVYIRTPFPMGKKGLMVKDGKVTPNGQELQQMLATFGPSVKPGDQARITDVVVKDDRIRFELNGGPVKKQKWYQHIQVSTGGPTAGTPSDSAANPRGTYVDLVFAHAVPDIGPQQLKSMLRPVLDFDAKSAAEAYLETVPPAVKAAIQKHEVLVGMNREMVIYAKGRAPKKDREKDGDAEYEEWIYGEPPANVDFVRFVGDEVVRVETMKVGGEKIVRTDKELSLTPQPSLAQQQPETRPTGAPTLRRPGEEAPNSTPNVYAPHTAPSPPTGDQGSTSSPTPHYHGSE